MPDLEELLRRIVMDYGSTCCDHLDTCDCSMAQAARAIDTAEVVA